MAKFDLEINELLKNEGGYVNNPNDTGGETNFGITKSVAVSNGYSGNMKDLPLQKAKDIYKKIYWDSLNLDKINSQEVAGIAFDISVNMGVIITGKMLQEMVNFMSTSNIVVDGQIGNVSISKINEIDTSKEKELAVLLLSFLQGERYLSITRAREKNETFIFGWLRRAKKNMGI